MTINVAPPPVRVKRQLHRGKSRRQLDTIQRDKAFGDLLASAGGSDFAAFKRAFAAFARAEKRLFRGKRRKAKRPRQNSQKPVEFYDFVEPLCPAPRYAYLFSRYRHNEKWDCHGDEAPAALDEAAP